MRLQVLRKYVMARARRRWHDVAGRPIYVGRVLDVIKGQLSYVIGTVYMDMPMKPNVLEDLARDVGFLALLLPMHFRLILHL